MMLNEKLFDISNHSYILLYKAYEEGEIVYHDITVSFNILGIREHSRNIDASCRAANNRQSSDNVRPKSTHVRWNGNFGRTLCPDRFFFTK